MKFSNSTIKKSIIEYLLAVAFMVCTSSLLAQKQLIIEQLTVNTDTSVFITHNSASPAGSIALSIKTIGNTTPIFSFANIGGYTPGTFSDGYASWFHGSSIGGIDDIAVIATFGADESSPDHSAVLANSTHAGFFTGDVEVTGIFTNPSDFKLKKNIRDLEKVIPLVMKLRPKSYFYDYDNYKSLPHGKRIGLIAQDLQKVFPELVHESANPLQKGQSRTFGKSRSELIENKMEKEKHLSIDYISIIPYLISAIQEQQLEIDKLKSTIEQLKK